ncbi:ZNF683 isoform 7, partial [Pan troglodytes]
MKEESAAQLGCCHRPMALGGTGGSLSPSLDFQLFRGDQPAPLGTDLHGLQEDTLSMKHEPPGLHASSTDDKKFTVKYPQNKDKLGKQPERAGEGAPCPAFSSHNSSSPPPLQNRKSPSPLAFCPCPPVNSISKELPFLLHTFYPGYPLLLPPPH